jgi:hypothetical protein
VSDADDGRGGDIPDDGGGILLRNDIENDGNGTLSISISIDVVLMGATITARIPSPLAVAVLVADRCHLLVVITVLVTIDCC